MILRFPFSCEVSFTTPFPYILPSLSIVSDFMTFSINISQLYSSLIQQFIEAYLILMFSYWTIVLAIPGKLDQK